jgi:hypothetical protein
VSTQVLWKTCKSGYLYDDLSLFADKKLTKEQLQRDNASLFQNDDLGVTPQRSGTCPAFGTIVVAKLRLAGWGESARSAVHAVAAVASASVRDKRAIFIISPEAVSNLSCSRARATALTPRNIWSSSSVV